MKQTARLLLPCLLAFSAATASAEPLRVVASFSILGDLVRNVGGDLVDVTVLCGPNGDAHTFEPTPSDGVALHGAALIVENGLGFEGWMNDLVLASGTTAVRVPVTRDVTPRRLGDDGHAHHDHDDHHHHEHHHGHHHHHGEVDPHAWQSVSNVVIMVDAIREALSRAQPAHAGTFARRATAYTTELQALDARIRDRVAAIPQSRRKLITTHDSLGYFAEAYGFEVVGSVVGSVSTEVADPSAQGLAALATRARMFGVRAIFAENMHGGGFAETLAESAGIAVVDTLFTDALGEPGSDGDTYIRMMDHNSSRIADALTR